MPVGIPQARSDSDPVLETQIKALEKQAEAEGLNRPQGKQTQWMRPTAQQGSTGDIFDMTDMGLPFNRDQSNAWFVEAIKDATNPGSVGDMIVTTTQIDYLAIMERSFRSRQAYSRAKAMLHMSARKAGHGHDNGPLVQAVLEHVRALVKKNKGAAAT